MSSSRVDHKFVYVWYHKLSENIPSSLFEVTFFLRFFFWVAGGLKPFLNTKTPFQRIAIRLGMELCDVLPLKLMLYHPNPLLNRLTLNTMKDKYK